MSLNRHLDKDDRQMTKRLKKVSNISSHQGIDSLERGKGLANGGGGTKRVMWWMWSKYRMHLNKNAIGKPIICILNIHYWIIYQGAGEMAQLLRGINVLPEVRLPLPTLGDLQPTVTPSPQDPIDFLASTWICMHVAHTLGPIYMCACSNKNNRNTDLEKCFKSP